ncbi:helix-turn-helix domain-containing protein [Micromonospora carbonacea]|uniref:Helix-turn-helix domain n=1 Tax=Micromonospora carbonacea TaxID=47853 RepID=A0A1C5ACK6_9ACTN|nr:helix-turn-helix transcriptional regulator [Micromonospora carbonacea]SCF42982.1 Helix-turn-helix domain [Micromonospora carbonacea]
MTVVVDLHRDDTRERERLAATLRRHRERRGISQVAAAARYGCNKFGLSQMERRRNWQVATVQAWARIYGYRLNLTTIGLPLPDDGDTLAALYDAQQPATAADEDRLDLRIAVNNLARIRRAAGLTCAEMGARMGCSESAAYRREALPDGAMVASLQQYTRALGGVLHLDVVPAWQAVAA